MSCNVFVGWLVIWGK